MSSFPGGSFLPPPTQHCSPMVINLDDDASIADTISSIGKVMLPHYMVMANKLMKQMCQKRRIRNSDEFATNLFIPLYESITGKAVEGAIRCPECEEESLLNLELLLEQLSADLHNTPLSHISAEALIAGDKVATYNLLEILQGLAEYAMKKGQPVNLAAGDDEPLSTFRSQDSTIGLPDDDFSYDDDVGKTNVSGRGDTSHPGRLPAADKVAHVGSPVACWETPSRVASPSRSPPEVWVERRSPVLIERASTGSSVTDDADKDGVQALSLMDSQTCAKLRKQMRRAERRADRVGLIAQLLSNCALADRLNARRGRRALREVSGDDNRSELSTVDDERTDDTVSLDDSTLCGDAEEEELPGMSLSSAALKRLQKFIDPIISEPPFRRPTDAVEKQRMAAERRVMAEARRRECILSRMVRREIASERRLRDLAERRAAEVQVRADEKSARIANARAKRYGAELMRELSALKAKMDHSAEEVIRDALAEGGRVERQHRLALERQVREAGTKHAAVLKDDIHSLENFYHDQFCELTESAKDEKESIEIEASAKKMQNSHMKQELRRKLESDIRTFQESLRTDADDAVFYRRLDAQRALEYRQKALRRK